MCFYCNGEQWNICYIDGNSSHLRRSDGVYSLGVTDATTKTVYVNKNLKGRLLTKVVTHEIVHVAMFSYHIHIPLEQEEFIADYIATYGREIIDIADDVLARFVKVI